METLILVNNGSDNVLLPNGTKPLSEPIFWGCVQAFKCVVCPNIIKLKLVLVEFQTLCMQGLCRVSYIWIWSILQCSWKVFVGHQTICLMILTGSSRHFKKIIRNFILSIYEKFFRRPDNLSDDFEQIIRHFAESMGNVWWADGFSWTLISNN